MIILLLSFILSLNIFACDFTEGIQKVYSLSGVVTLTLKDLDLLKGGKLKGVSVFHPVDKKEFSGRFLPGGVFLSHELIKEFSGAVVFFDESRELARTLKRYPGIRAVEMKTRGLTPLEVVRYVEKQLSPFLKGCSLSDHATKTRQKLEKLKFLVNNRPYFLFFLGTIDQYKLPELLMVQDGVVKWMIQENLIQTYPSDLAYVNWSARIMNELPKNVKKVGIKDSGSDMEVKLEKINEGINLTYPGAFIPGLGQVEAMIYLFEKATF